MQKMKKKDENFRFKNFKQNNTTSGKKMKKRQGRFPRYRMLHRNDLTFYESCKLFKLNK